MVETLVMRGNMQSIFHQPGVVPHTADPNDEKNVKHSRQLEPETRHHAGTHIQYVFQLTFG